MRKYLQLIEGVAIVCALVSVTPSALARQNAVARDLCINCQDMKLIKPSEPGLLPFFMAETEVDWRHYLMAVKEDGCPIPENTAKRVIPDAASLDDDYAVTGMKFEGMECYIRWRSRRDHTSYRLPSSREWLYVARRAYSSSRTESGKTPTDVPDVNEPRDAVRGGVVLHVRHGAPSPDGLYGLLDSAAEMTSDSEPGSARECGAFKVAKCTRHFLYGGRAGSTVMPIFERAFILDTYTNGEVGFRLAHN